MRRFVAKEVPIFDFNDGSTLPLWVQLRDRMAYLISSRYYEPGEKLPTVRRFAADLKIAYNTVSKAYMGLERDGYVATVRGSGVFVNDLSVLPDVGPRADLMVEEFVESCLEVGMTYEDIPKLVSKHVRRMRKEHEAAGK